MRKKVFTLLLVLGLVAAQPLTAGATAPSGSTSVTVGGDDNAAYNVAPASEQFTGDRAPVAATLDRITQFNSSQIQSEHAGRCGWRKRSGTDCRPDLSIAVCVIR